MEPAASGAIPQEMIASQLGKILASATFVRSQRMSRFLRFTVEQSLAGRADRLKEYLIGVEVYDKPETLDPRFDPIVRVEAGRLRAKLREYYEADGRGDPILISFPKRSYAPVFEWNRPAEEPLRSEEGGQSIAVLPLVDLSVEQGLAHFCDGLADEVNAALTGVEGVRVVARSAAMQMRGRVGNVREIGRELRATALIEGSVRSQGERLRVTLLMVDCADGFHVWSETRECRVSEALEFQCSLSAAVARRVKNGGTGLQAGSTRS